jgi:hypothetical protein
MLSASAGTSGSRFFGFSSGVWALAGAAFAAAGDGTGGDAGAAGVDAFGGVAALALGGEDAFGGGDAGAGLVGVGDGVTVDAGAAGGFFEASAGAAD